MLRFAGILNSKLATFFHFNASPKATKGSFPKILVKDIKDFPLPRFEDVDAVSEIVDRLAIAVQNGNNSTRQVLENELDEKVYSLYELTEPQKQMLRQL